MMSTITPPSNVINLTRQDPKVRLADYREGLEFYLGVSSEFIDRIVFIENSNSDLRAIKQVVETVKHDKNLSLFLLLMVIIFYLNMAKYMVNLE